MRKRIKRFFFLAGVIFPFFLAIHPVLADQSGVSKADRGVQLEKNNTPAPAMRFVSALVSSNGQLLDTRIALADQRIRLLEEENTRLHRNLEQSAKEIKSLWLIRLATWLDSWFGLLFSAGFISLFTWLGGRNFFGKMREDVYARLSEKYDKKVTKLVDYQFREAELQIMARDRNICLLGNKGDPEYKWLKEAVESIGFKNITTSLDDAGLVVVVGGEFCNDKEVLKNLIDNFGSETVPVIFFSGKENMDLTVLDKFKLATPFKNKATTLVHLQNLAHLAVRKW